LIGFMRIYVYMMIFIALTHSQLYAEITGSVTTVVGYFSNVLRDSTKIDDTQSQTSLSLIFEGNRGTIFYNGYLEAYQTVNERNIHVHQIGYLYERELRDDRGFIEAGGSVNFQIDQPENDIYDSNEIELYVSTKYYLRDNWMLRGSYAFDRASYPNFPTADFTENRLFAQSNYFFATRTTLRLQSVMGWSNQVLSLMDSIATQGSAGVRWQNSVRIAQSIFTKTGVSLEWTNYYTKSTEDVYVGAFLDSRYTYTGNRISLMLTRRFVPNMTGRLSYTASWLDYLSDAPDQFDEKRRDDIQTISLYFSRSFDNIPLLVFLNLSTRENQSNDALFEYRSNLCTLGASWNF